MFAKYFVRFEHGGKLMISGFADLGSAERFALAKGGDLLEPGKKDFKLVKSFK